MLNCKEATQRVEQMKFENVGVYKKISLKLHLAMCDVCRKYKMDSASIDRMLKKNTLKVHKGFTLDELEILVKKVNG